MKKTLSTLSNFEIQTLTQNQFIKLYQKNSKNKKIKFKINSESSKYVNKGWKKKKKGEKIREIYFLILK